MVFLKVGAAGATKLTPLCYGVDGGDRQKQADCPHIGGPMYKAGSVPGARLIRGSGWERGRHL